MADFDLAIVGGGPAGLIAAGYALHANLRTALFTRELGGKVNYPFALHDLTRKEPVWGADLVHDFEERLVREERLIHCRRPVAKVKHDEENKLFQLRLASHEEDEQAGEEPLGNVEEVQARAVIIATGAAPQRLFVAGEKEYWGRGVSFSAVSHAPYFAGRDVAVVGGGRRALVAVLELGPICRHVHFIAAHSQVMTEWPEARRVREQSNVSVFNNWEVQEIVGNGFVNGINLVGANGETRHLPVEGVFIEFALLPNNELVRDLVTLDHDGHIVVDQRCATNVPGLFAAGDVTNICVEQVLVAIGEGAKAALGAWEYIATNF